MAAIVIRDLNINKELDRKAMAMVVGGINPPALPNGWTVTSTSTQKSDAGQIWIPSTKNILGVTGAYEIARAFQYVTRVTAEYTEYRTS